MSLLSEEQWRPIPGYEGLYEASDHGRVRSLGTGRVLPSAPDHSGYYAVTLRRNGGRERLRVHTLVLMSFVGPRPERVRTIRRLDGDKLNNWLDNLAYGTPQPETLDDLRLQAHVTSSGCWEWTGKRDSNGYGQTRWRGQKIRVHRLATHLAHGLDLSNTYEYARHTCDNPPCFNPDHLQPGTPTDNQQDAIQRARRIRSECKRGHPFTSDNVAYDGVKGRRCRTCDNHRKRQWEERQRAKGAIPWGKREATCPHCGSRTSNGYLSAHLRRMHSAALTG